MIGVALTVGRVKLAWVMHRYELVAACLDGHRRVLDTIDRVNDDELTYPSLLPGWSRADVIAWLALKSQSHSHLFGGPAAGEVRSQFPEGYEQAEMIRGEIVRGATHLRSTLAVSFSDLEEAWARLPDGLWDSQGVTSAGRRSMTDIVARHLRDVEVHHVDLGAGYSIVDWPAQFVDTEFTKRLPDLGGRAERAALLAWLLGRGPAPELGPW